MRSAISSPVGSGDIPVEDGDVVGVEAQQLQGGIAVTCDDLPRSLPGVARRGWLLPYRARPPRSIRARSDATSWRISSAYRKPDTCWQHHARLTGGMTYGEPARTTTRRFRIRWIRVAGLLVLIAAIAAALGSSCRRPRPRRQHHPSASFVVITFVCSARALSSTVWPAEGQAAFVAGRTVADRSRPEPAPGSDRQRRKGDDGLPRAP